MQMYLGGAPRTRDRIFPRLRGGVTFHRVPGREKARNSARIIAITRINLHPELPP